MAEAKLFIFSKRKNSTKIPTGGTAINVELKGGASILEPVFLLNYDAGVPTFNMVEFEGRFYHINTIRSVRANLYELACAVDVLSTYKNNILNSEAFVAYRDHNNTEISDARIPTKTTATTAIKKASFDTLGSGGYSVVINVTGTNKCASFALSETRANELLNSFISWYNSGSSYVPDYSGSVFSDIEEGLKALCDMIRGTVRQTLATGNVGDSIKSAYAIPIPLSSFGGLSERIYLGNYDTGKNGQLITDRVFSDGCTIEIPWQASDWRRNAPYHEIYVYIPYVGMINLSASDLIGFNELHISCNIDKCNGDAIFNIWVGDSKHILGQYCANIGSTYAIGAANITPLQAATGLGSAAGGAAALIAGVSGAGAVAAAGSVGLGLLNALNANVTTISANGGGASLGLTGQCSCFTIFHNTIVEPSNISALHGTPESKVMNLSGLTGYVQTQDFSISGNMTDNEREQINSMMDGGVYIE